MEYKDCSSNSSCEELVPESDSSEDQPLIYDVIWPTSQVFNYSDPDTLSPQIIAVLHNNVSKLRKLFKSGKSPNANDNLGNTPLHVAVIKQKFAAFKYLLKHRHVRIDAQNFDGSTPLILSLICNQLEYTKKLIKAGADVTIANNEKNTPLHYAAELNLYTVEKLLKKGADVNALNILDESPLYLACSKAQESIAYKLLQFGADPAPKSCNNFNAFHQALLRCSPELQKILYLYTFDHDQTECCVQDLLCSLKTDFFNIFTEEYKCLEYCKEDVYKLCLKLPEFTPGELQTIIRCIPEVVVEAFQVTGVMVEFISLVSCQPRTAHNTFECVKVLFSSDLAAEIMQGYEQKCALVHHLVIPGGNLEETTQLICLMMSYGIELYGLDLDTVYRFFGYCDLFKFMLHMDIHDGEKNFYSSLITLLMYDMEVNIDLCLEHPTKFLFEPSMEPLIPFFALPKFKELCGLLVTTNREFARLSKLPEVPSLVELSRNACRKFIKEKFEVKNSKGFYTVLAALPIAQKQKDIIALKTPIYDVY